MTQTCAICKKTWRNEDVKMYHVPKNIQRRKEWSEATGLTFSEHSRICDKHFQPSDFIVREGEGARRRLKFFVVPKPFLPSKDTHDVPCTTQGVNLTSAASEAPVAIETNQPIVYSSCSSSSEHFATIINEDIAETTIEEDFKIEIEDSSIMTEEYTTPIEDSNTASLQKTNGANTTRTEIVYAMEPIEYSIPLNDKVLIKYVGFTPPPTIMNVGGAIKVADSMNIADASTQTYQEMIQAGETLDLMRMRKEIRSLDSERKRLIKRLKEFQEYNLSLQKILTERQIQKLRNPSDNIIWLQNDIADAKELYDKSPKAYKYLLRKGFPLPAVSTLSKRPSGTDENSKLEENDIDSIQDESEEDSAADSMEEDKELNFIPADNEMEFITVKKETNSDAEVDEIGSTLVESEMNSYLSANEMEFLPVKKEIDSDPGDNEMEFIATQNEMCLSEVKKEMDPPPVENEMVFNAVKNETISNQEAADIKRNFVP